MRTTIRLEEGLLREAKRVAAQRGQTLTAVIEDALRESFARRRSAQSASRVVLPVSRGGGRLQPGVDLDDSAALLDLMESHDASR
jgi:hypothetical protein